MSTSPICSQCTLFLALENIRKPYGFLMFSGVRERCIGNESVKIDNGLLIILAEEIFYNNQPYYYVCINLEPIPQAFAFNPNHNIIFEKFH